MRHTPLYAIAILGRRTPDSVYQAARFRQTIP
jgi:hypothetical protein